MASKNTTANANPHSNPLPLPDPLAGLPVATGTPPAPPAPNVVPLRRKKKLTGQAYKDARDFARKATGYDETSPIWGMRQNVVLTTIETDLEAGIQAIGRGDYADGLVKLENALALNRELQKRLATGQLIAAQS